MEAHAQEVSGGEDPRWKRTLYWWWLVERADVSVTLNQTRQELRANLGDIAACGRVGPIQRRRKSLSQSANTDRVRYLSLRKECLGSEHLDTLRAKHNLAITVKEHVHTLCS